tara:strand:- start:612 stop:1403 length:792 start_codon:yes stop_codon:yes gene_type:complete
MFSFLAELLATTFLGFGAIYPLLLWLSPHKLIQSGFYRFNQGMVSIIISIGMIFIYLSLSHYNNFFLGVFWLFIQLVLTAVFWKTKHINNIFISIPPIIGVLYLILVINQIFLINLYLSDYLIIFISYSIIASVFFSMILGHWYLNVIQLPIKLLKNSIILLSFLLIIRLFWNIYALTAFEVTDNYGINLSLFSFLWTFEGFLLLVAIFFGLIVPIILNVFIWYTLQIQSTQSATGLIYVSVVSLLFGDLFYKYYAFRFGIIV